MLMAARSKGLARADAGACPDSASASSAYPKQMAVPRPPQLIPPPPPVAPGRAHYVNRGDLPRRQTTDRKCGFPLCRRMCESLACRTCRPHCDDFSCTVHWNYPRRCKSQHVWCLSKHPLPEHSDCGFCRQHCRSERPGGACEWHLRPANPSGIRVRGARSSDEHRAKYVARTAGPPPSP